MVYYPNEVVLARNVQIRHELIVHYVVRQVQIVDWELHQVLKFTPLVPDPLKTLQLDC
jgi:hypothetical protein